MNMTINIEGFIRKNRKLIAILVAALLLIYLGKTGGLQLLPGPEGVDFGLHGVEASGSVQIEDKNYPLTFKLNKLSEVGKAQPGDWIAYGESGESEEEFRYGYCWARPDPKTPVIKAETYYVPYSQELDGIRLEIRVQRPSFEELNKRGSPLPGTDPTQIEWFSYDLEKTKKGNQIRWKHYEVYIVPVDIVIEFSARPIGDDDWGAFKDVTLWFYLNTEIWADKFTKEQMLELREKPEDIEIAAYNFRGAFPIWAWVGGWDAWVGADDPSQSDYWIVYGEDGDPDNPYDYLSPEEYAEIEQYLQLQPSFAGSEVTLYKSPNWIYERTYTSDLLKDREKLKNQLINDLNKRDPGYTVFVPITLTKYGILKRWGGWWITYWENYYYPTSYLRIRALYAVWGEWIFLWTQEEAEKHDYKWQNRTSVIRRHKSLWDQFFGGIGEWISNPFNQLWILFFTIVVIIIIVSVFSPGVWTILARALFGRRKEP